ncbi:MAG: NAD(P)H-dependent glycerol-3-phosphate dehydrogenase [Ruminococcus bromii]|nr:NAD(P)H-dependent glycerol-3-phosphate dehydrogenase [Ruminococcus bromii]MCI7212132.1 NAD(P)H-dependent glycerol-3-phosphate dehydrogenase [Ruminococcus bromii]MDD6433172.1 NAD(P)H-dependent glycerol-3-phosphate dehydrogenase [Ruminococcus bromii]MDY4084859.1 NAD(P)H-dependent glycerol-3-phosphate dehydrogenase [Ruminococcus bromii]MDY4710573.1 NAD(P)H-dependent glycerol-3-phosphate dehydrogenase [Ruminococcus bromii]
MDVSVLGCGRWGSCIAWYLDKIGHNVLSCGLKDAPEFIQLEKYHKNDYLTFPDSIEVSSDLEKAVKRAEVIVISISSQYLRSYFEDISKYNLDGKIIVLCMKGVEATTGKRLSEVVGDFVDESKTPVAVWVGPGHPQDYVKGIPNCMVIDSNNQEVKEKLVNEFTSELIRFYLGTDLIGSEIGAAAKNVIGIAAGILDGLNYTSLKGALMARGTREISRLIKALGGNEMSAYGLCHLGDYEATLFSQWSHNRKFGEEYVKGNKFNKLAEGVMTSKALYKLGKENNVELPIVESIYNVLFNDMDVKEAIGKLFLRSVKKEF